MHSVFRRVFDNRLIFPPIRNPRKVLECGFGAGDWAIEVAERFENCEVCSRSAPEHLTECCCLPVSRQDRGDILLHGHGTGGGLVLRASRGEMFHQPFLAQHNRLALTQPPSIGHWHRC